MLPDVKKRLRYEPKTGKWFWIHHSARPDLVGTRAGYARKDGRWVVSVFGHKYLASRLAWFYMTGRWPPNEVDHENRVCSDDRWKNLRSATHPENGRNLKMFKNNTSGHKGVFHSRGKWRAYIQGRHLGCYETKDAATKAYATAAVKKFGAFGGATCHEQRTSL